MKTVLFFSILAITIIVSCSKTESIPTNTTSLVGGWKSDSSIYRGYNNNRLIKEEVDRDGQSEEETLYFFDDGTFKYYYVSLETPGERDTLETTLGNYTFNAATQALILEDKTHHETCIVLTLNEKQLTYSATINNPQNPDLPDINKEITSFYLSRFQ